MSIYRAAFDALLFSFVLFLFHFQQLENIALKMFPFLLLSQKQPSIQNAFPTEKHEFMFF